MNEEIGCREGEEGEGHRRSEGECRSSLIKGSEGEEVGPEGVVGSSGDLAQCGTMSCIGGNKWKMVL